MKRICAGTILATALSSCTAGPNYRPPAVLTPSAASPALIEAAGPAFSPGDPPADWWQLYQAPDLDALVAKALRRNTDLRAALANIEATQAALRGTELERTVQTSLNAAPSYGQASADDKGAAKALNPGPVFAWSGGISYDLDLAGRLRRSIEANTADVDEARAALDVARVNVAAAVTGAYATVCAAGDEIAVTQRSIVLARRIVTVTDRRFRGGIAGVNDGVRARALLAQTEAGMPGMIARQRAGLYLLATLVGDPPEAFPKSVADCATPPVLRRLIPVGDGAALLKRRPDVRQAERQLAGAVARIGIATSALYPSVTLGGQAGTIATRGGDILSNRGFTWGLGPLVQWTFPNVAATRAQIAQAGALARGRLARFDGTVLVALRETETALSNLTRQMDTERAMRDAQAQATIAARNTERLYRGGLGQFIDTLDAERTLIQSDAALADARAQIADRQVALFLALGGGWQHAPRPDETPLDAVAVGHK